MTATTSNKPLSDFCSKNDFASHPDNPLTEAEFNWQFKNRNYNGFKDAFVKVNARKYLVHVPTYIQCLANRRGA
jgi:hypothetical protein